MAATYKQLNRETGRFETKIWNPFPPSESNRAKKRPHKEAKGVAKSGERYKAYITINNKQIVLGRFKTEEEAIAVRKKAYAAKYNS